MIKKVSLVILLVIISLSVFNFLANKKAKADYNSKLNSINWNPYIIKDNSSQLIERNQYLSMLKKETAELPNKPSENIFWVKVVFSAVFCLSALFVILSRNYDDETKKWAFSILTLIAGVWIGTVS